MRQQAAPAPTSSGQVGWGILATGGVAKLFTRDLVAHGHRIVAVGSRSAESAQTFAAEFGIPAAHASYDDLVADPAVDVVYVATPHTFHAANAVAALRNGKHVLIEKSFTLNASQARDVLRLAQQRNLLVVEAMWTRFLPHMQFVRDAASSGRIGNIIHLHADHTQRLSADPEHRLNNLELGGGALLDLGVYPVSLAHDILGIPTDIAARAVMRDTGVDAAVATIFHHGENAVSTTYSTSQARGANMAVVAGTDGRIEVGPNWLGPSPVTVLDTDNAVVERFEQPLSGRGMQYQAAEVERLLAAGKTSSDVITPDDSVAVMATLDEIRSIIGVRYPDE